MNYSTKLLFILNFKKASEIKKINYFQTLKNNNFESGLFHFIG